MAHDGHASTNNGYTNPLEHIRNNCKLTISGHSGRNGRAYMRAHHNSQGDCTMQKTDVTEGSNKSNASSIPAIPFSISGECYSAGQFGTETIEGYRSEVVYSVDGATNIYRSLLTNGRLRLNGKWVCGLPLGSGTATPVYNQSPYSQSPAKDDLWCYDLADGGVYPIGSQDQKRRYIVVITSCNFIDSDLNFENEDATQDPVTVPEFVSTTVNGEEPFPNQAKDNDASQPNNAVKVLLPIFEEDKSKWPTVIESIRKAVGEIFSSGELVLCPKYQPKDTVLEAYKLHEMTIGDFLRLRNKLTFQAVAYGEVSINKMPMATMEFMHMAAQFYELADRDNVKIPPYHSGLRDELAVDCLTGVYGRRAVLGTNEFDQLLRVGLVTSVDAFVAMDAYYNNLKVSK